MPSGRCLFVVALPRRRPEVDGFVCAGRSVRNLWRAQMFAEWSPHNNILRASPTREANLVRWREILRSSSCAPISLRRSMIPVSERICRCARVMSSCAVIGDTRAREWSEYRNLTTAHAMEPDGLAGDPQVPKKVRPALCGHGPAPIGSWRASGQSSLAKQRLCFQAARRRRTPGQASAPQT